MTRQLKPLLPELKAGSDARSHDLIDGSIAGVFELPLGVPLISFKCRKSSKKSNKVSPRIADDFICNAVNYFLAASPVFEGYSLVGKSLSELCPDSELSAFIVQELKGLHDVTAAFKISANGHTLLFSAHFCRLKPHDESCYDFFGVLTPALRTAEHSGNLGYWTSHDSANNSAAGPMLAAMLGNMPYPAYFRDAFGKYHYFNDAFVEICDKDKSFVTAHTASEILTSDYIDTMIKSDSKLISSKQSSVESELRVFYGDEERYYLVTKSLITSADGILNGIGGLLVDVSGLRELQRDLAEAKSEVLTRYQFFKQLANSIPAPFYYSDTGSRIIGYNRAFLQSFAKDKQNITGMHISDILPTELATWLAAVDQKQLVDMEQRDFKAKVSFENAPPRIYHFFRDTFKDRDGKTGGIITIAFDITKQTELEAALRQSEERWQLVIQATNDGIFDWNLQEKELFISDRMLEIMRLPRNHMPVSFDSWVDRIDPSDVASRNMFKALCQGNYPGSRFEREFKVLRDDATYCWVGFNAIQVRDYDGNLMRVVGSVSDITERKGHEEQILYRATHDSLTGLLNRLIYLDYLHQAIAQSKRDDTKLAVVYLDMNDFKAINDTFGHDVGDHFLKVVADRLKTQARDFDNVARMGGDEFSFFIRGVDSEEMARNILGRHAKSLSEPIEIDGQTIYPSGSFGFSLFPEHATDVDTLIKKADAAMYHAKRNRKQSTSSPVEMWSEVLSEG